MTDESFLDKLRAPFAPPAPPVPPRRARDPFATTSGGGSGAGWAATALANEVDILAGTAPGGINDQINRSAFNLGQIIAAGELDQQECWDALYDAAAQASSGDVGGGWIEATLRSGFTSGAQHPRTIPDRQDTPPWSSASPNGSSMPPYAVSPGTSPASATPAPLPVSSGDPDAPAVSASSGQTDAQPDVDASVREHLPLVDWHTLWADETEEEWIIEPILPARRLVAVYSPPKVGKSLLMLELAAAVAGGRAVLGVTPDRPRVVLYIDFENDPKSDIRQRLRAMGYGPLGLANLAYLSFPTLAYLDSARGGEQLMAAVRVYEAEVVIIDTVSRAVEGEENDNDTWLDFYRHTGLAMKRAGIALIRLDHSGKDEAKGQRGGSAKGGDVDAVWRLSTVTRDEVYRLDCEMNRMPVVEKTLTLHRRNSPLRHDVDPAGRAAIGRLLDEARIAALLTASFPIDGARRAAHRIMVDAGTKGVGTHGWSDFLEKYVQRVHMVRLSGAQGSAPDPFGSLVLNPEHQPKT